MLCLDTVFSAAVAVSNNIDRWGASHQSFKRGFRMIAFTAVTGNSDSYATFTNYLANAFATNSGGV
jgi:hypothetical protein